MKLNVLERLTALAILPSEGNFVTLKILRDLKANLGITEAEFKEFNIEQKGAMTTWNTDGEVEKEIKVGEKATDIIVEALRKLDDTDKLTDNHFSLYEKFIGE